MEARLKQIIADILGISELDEITDESSPKTIENWDSLQQLNLIIAFEEEFDISISADEAIEMVNVGAIKSILRSKKVAI